MFKSIPLEHIFTETHNFKETHWFFACMRKLVNGDTKGATMRILDPLLPHPPGAQWLIIYKTTLLSIESNKIWNTSINVREISLLNHHI